MSYLKALFTERFFLRQLNHQRRLLLSLWPLSCFFDDPMQTLRLHMRLNRFALLSRISHQLRMECHQLNIKHALLESLAFVI